MRNQVPGPVASRLRRVQWLAFVVGVVALAATAVGAVIAPAQFFPAYLFAFLFWLGLALGCLLLTMLHELAGGMWGAVMLRFVEAGMSVLPLMLLLFVPIVLGLQYLYPWARPDAVAQDSILQHQSVYLNIPFFLIRAALYFVLWIGMAYFLRRWSLERDRAPSPQLDARLRLFSAIGLVVFGLTATFATIDWIMSLEPHWYSSIYAAMVVMGGILSAFAFTVLVIAWLDAYAPISQVMAPSLINDLGSLLLAFVMLWAYLAFSQFMLIYAGNLTREVPWYVNRLQGGWEWVALTAASFEFVLPFFLLLFRDIKRKAVWLAVVAGVLVLARVVDVYWLVIPAFSPGVLTFHWLDLTALIGLGGLWLALFAWHLRRHPILPVHDRHLVKQAEAEFANERPSP